MSETFSCYAVRRLNPFSGVMEVVETDGARALSGDGHHWQLEVEAERPGHTWGRDDSTVKVRQFFRFGSWHAERGLSRVPVNPLLDIGAMLAASERIIASLQAVQDELPFPFADRFEHWLLDSDGQPLALLAATVAERHTAAIQVDRWLATAPNNAAFVAPSLTALAVPTQDNQGNRPHADRLERQIRDAAGNPARCSWYERRADGTARPLDDACPPLPPEAFPELPLRAVWDDVQQQSLVDDYLHWLSPLLLSLTGLSDACRRDLERAACRQALQVADHFKLYPKVLQQDLLDSARVEARLRRTAG